MKRIRLTILLAVACAGLRAQGASAEPASPLFHPEFLKLFTKTEYRIPMRDGAKLFTLVVAPKDTSTNYPILLGRRPFQLAFWDTSLATLMEGGPFILVLQHVRGRYQSEGTFTAMPPFNPAKGPTESDESSDAWDTIDWLVKNVPNNNGRVGIFKAGASIFGLMAMINLHPALKAVSPQASMVDWFMGDDLHHNGAFFLSQNFGMLYTYYQLGGDPMTGRGPEFDFGIRDGYEFFLRMGPLGNTEKLLRGAVPDWSAFLAHPNYDAFWQARNIRPHLKNIHCAVLNVCGWFDAENVFGTLETYRWTERQNPGIQNTLVMGPWSHNQWNSSAGDRLGDVAFGSDTADYFRQEVELPFFRHHLLGDTNYTPAEAVVFQTGANQWRRFDQWPPRNTESKTFYLQDAGQLAFTPPGRGDRAFDEYVSDPAKPVPFTKVMTTHYPDEYPVEDQRFVATRPDVLVYQTEPLTAELTIAGPIQVSLNVSTTGTDADWVVKLIDVYAPDFPDPQPNPTRVVMGGYQQLLRGDVMRSRFRKSFEKPEPMKPGNITPIEFTMQDVFHTFRRGHRVMVQVQSSWFPLVDRNPQTFVPNIAYAKPEDFRKATHRVYRSAKLPSSISIGALPLQDQAQTPTGQ
jgi:putative CocE/NonD family hydrolase